MNQFDNLYNALFSLVKNVTWANGGHFITKSDTVVMANKVMFDQQPAIMRSVDGIQVNHKVGGSYRHIHNMVLIVYHHGGFDNDGAPILSETPSQTTTEIINAIMTAIEKPDTPFDVRNTLGGLAYDCMINGKIDIVNGDIDGQSVIIIPVQILVP